MAIGIISADVIRCLWPTAMISFDGEYYHQVHGAPMGSPVSVVVSDMYMEDLEDKAMDTAPQDTRPSMWR